MITQCLQYVLDFPAVTVFCWNRPFAAFLRTTVKPLLSGPPIKRTPYIKRTLGGHPLLNGHLERSHCMVEVSVDKNKRNIQKCPPQPHSGSTECPVLILILKEEC